VYVYRTRVYLAAPSRTPPGEILRGFAIKRPNALRVAFRIKSFPRHTGTCSGRLRFISFRVCRATSTRPRRPARPPERYRNNTRCTCRRRRRRRARVWFIGAVDCLVCSTTARRRDETRRRTTKPVRVFSVSAEFRSACVISYRACRRFDDTIRARRIRFSAALSLSSLLSHAAQYDDNGTTERGKNSLAPLTSRAPQTVILPYDTRRQCNSYENEPCAAYYRCGRRRRRSVLSRQTVLGHTMKKKTGLIVATYFS